MKHIAILTWMLFSIAMAVALNRSRIRECRKR